MNTGIIAVLISQACLLVAVSIVSYRNYKLNKKLEALGEFVQMFANATMDHIFELRDAALKENNQELMDKFKHTHN